MEIGEIDQFSATNNNKLPFLTPEQAAAAHLEARYTDLGDD